MYTHSANKREPQLCEWEAVWTKPQESFVGLFYASVFSCYSGLGQYLHYTYFLLLSIIFISHLPCSSHNTHLILSLFYTTSFCPGFSSTSLLVLHFSAVAGCLWKEGFSMRLWDLLLLLSWYFLSPLCAGHSMAVQCISRYPFPFMC